MNITIEQLKKNFGAKVAADIETIPSKAVTCWAW